MSNHLLYLCILSYLLFCNTVNFNGLMVVYYQRELIAVQEEQIRIYRDSLVTGVGDDRIGNPADLVRLCNEAVAKKKTSCTTQFQRYLAVANPANGEDFFREVCSSSLVLSISLILIHMVLYTYSVFPWFR
jgi:hypothetical protein